MENDLKANIRVLPRDAVSCASPEHALNKSCCESLLWGVQCLAGGSGGQGPAYHICKMLLLVCLGRVAKRQRGSWGC